MKINELKKLISTAAFAYILAGTVNANTVTAYAAADETTDSYYTWYRNSITVYTRYGYQYGLNHDGNTIYMGELSQSNGVINFWSDDDSYDEWYFDLGSLFKISDIESITVKASFVSGRIWIKILNELQQNAVTDLQQSGEYTGDTNELVFYPSESDQYFSYITIMGSCGSSISIDSITIKMKDSSSDTTDDTSENSSIIIETEYEVEEDTEEESVEEENEEGETVEEEPVDESGSDIDNSDETESSSDDDWNDDEIGRNLNNSESEGYESDDESGGGSDDSGYEDYENDEETGSGSDESGSEDYGNDNKSGGSSDNSDSEDYESNDEESGSSEKDDDNGSGEASGKSDDSNSADAVSSETTSGSTNEVVNENDYSENIESKVVDDDNDTTIKLDSDEYYVEFADSEDKVDETEKDETEEDEAETAAVDGAEDENEDLDDSQSDIEDDDFVSDEDYYADKTNSDTTIDLDSEEYYVEAADLIDETEDSKVKSDDSEKGITTQSKANTTNSKTTTTKEKNTQNSKLKKSKKKYQANIPEQSIAKNRSFFPDQRYDVEQDTDLAESSYDGGTYEVAYSPDKEEEYQEIAETELDDRFDVKAKSNLVLKYSEAGREVKFHVFDLITVRNAQGKLVYKLITDNDLIKIDSDTGIVTISEGLTIGETYTVSIQVTDKGHDDGDYVTETVKVSFKVV